ncbi:hypothetical protein OPQ81_004966 [Rhizoctonia solani]|nr:hypothetical protein OPQ81_004966 [Rhizoctonia solani]
MAVYSHVGMLKARNKGTGYKQWRLDDFGFPLEAFAFQPEIDLLVLIEGIVLAHDTTVEPFGSVRRSIKSYRVHFRTMSTNDPHWLAGSPVLDTGLSGVSGSTKSNDTQVIISLNGRMVMVRSDTMDAIIENTIIVWDWVEGIEKLRIIIPPNPTLQTCFSCLLSEEYLVVSRTVHDHHHSGVTVDKSSGPQALQKTSTIGQLDIYRLVSESNRARRAATFELPSLCTPYAYWHTTMGFGPAKIPWTPFWLARMKHTPCIYETDPRNRMLSLFTSIWITDPSDPQSESDPASSHSLLHVPVGTLLDYLEPDLYNHPAVIPWGDWGVKVPWINISSCSYPPSNLTSISGLRHSIRDLHYYLNLPQSSDQGERFYDRQGILDFDTQRVKFARASRRGHPYLASGKPSDEIFMTRLNTSGNLLFETPVNLTPSYEKVHINVDSRPTVSEFLSCIIDDEYIIINVKESQPDTKPHSRIYAYTL